MFVNPKLDYITNRNFFYQKLTEELDHHLCDSWISNLSNTSALLISQMPEVNWVGFYLWDGRKLRLGPFQGLPACLHIDLGHGVCGKSAEQRESLIVNNVDEFPGHISCDSNSKSEIVIPMISNEGHLLGVLDIDSPIFNRFDEIDRQGLQKITAVLLNRTSSFKI